MAYLRSGEGGGGGLNTGFIVYLIFNSSILYTVAGWVAV